MNAQITDKQKIKLDDLIENNKLTTLGALCMVFVITNAIQQFFNKIKNEKQQN